ncbi:MAG TPA: hypothetical protein VF461_23150 [Gemmatimonadaceae bacterium]
MNRTLACKDRAPEVITALLRRARTGSVRDTLANLGAYVFRDGRLVDSVSALSRDSAQSTERRTRYLELLASYVDCHAAVDDYPGWQNRLLILAATTGQCGAHYEQPLPRDVRARAHAAITWMGAHDPDAQLRELSRRVAEQISDTRD